ncbi:MAG: ABC transporter ATP-binding protein, partial [Caulobacter sp.]
MTAPLSGAVLSAENLSVALGGRPVLQGVSARFRPGEVTAVVGPNGAGKSTLLACLAGLRKPDAGAVSLGDAALSALAHRERARRIGFLPQTPEVAWAVDVETLVGLGRTPHSGARGLSESDRRAVARAPLWGVRPRPTRVSTSTAQ